MGTRTHVINIIVCPKPTLHRQGYVVQSRSNDVAATRSAMVELVGTTYEGKPAVDVVVNGNVVKTCVNETSMSMLRFMQWVAKDNDYEIDYLDGQTAVCY